MSLILAPGTVLLDPSFRMGDCSNSSGNKISWKTVIDDPGRLGSRREQKIAGYNQDFGQLTWRFAWDLGTNDFGNFLDAVPEYENAYSKYLTKNRGLLDYLSNNASQVYDIEPNDVLSGENYLIQSPKATHLQDISVRRIMAQQGQNFNGSRLIQIRGVKENPDPVGKSLSPFKVPFHIPQIVRTHKSAPSIEDFWQKNRVVQLSPELQKMEPEQRSEYIQEV